MSDDDRPTVSQAAAPLSHRAGERISDDFDRFMREVEAYDRMLAAKEAERLAAERAFEDRCFEQTVRDLEDTRPGAAHQWWVDFERERGAEATEAMRARLAPIFARVRAENAFHRAAAAEAKAKGELEQEARAKARQAAAAEWARQQEVKIQVAREKAEAKDGVLRLERAIKTWQSWQTDPVLETLDPRDAKRVQWCRANGIPIRGSLPTEPKQPWRPWQHAYRAFPDENAPTCSLRGAEPPVPWSCGGLPTPSEWPLLVYMDSHAEPALVARTRTRGADGRYTRHSPTTEHVEAYVERIASYVEAREGGDDA
jgi:hypothetical protein